MEPEYATKFLPWLGRRLRPELMDCFSKCITIRNMRFPTARSSLFFDQFEKLMAELRIIAPAVAGPSHKPWLPPSDVLQFLVPD